MRDVHLADYSAAHVGDKLDEERTNCCLKPADSQTYEKREMQLVITHLVNHLIVVALAVMAMKPQIMSMKNKIL